MTTPTVPNSDAGVLANLGLDEVPDGLPDGVYPGFVYDAKIVDLKNNKGRSLVFTYKVDQPGSTLHGETIDEFKSINPGDDNTKKRFLKQRLESLGVPSTRFNVFQPKDVVGLAVSFTVKTNGEYKNVSKVEIRSNSGVTGNGQPAGTVTDTTTISGGASAPLSDLL